MKSKKNIVLIGMMGSGKSTIGKIIAIKLKLDFIDIDYEIEKKERKTIRNIFENNGESYFRKIEQNIIFENLKFKGKVISLGGGAFLNDSTKKKILKDTVSFWLNWDNSTIIKRVSKSYKRPKLDNLSRKDLYYMIKDRSKSYKDANYKINCENLTKIEISKKIISIYENSQN